MVNLDDAIIARLESHGETFEILLDPAAMDLIKHGTEIDLSKYLAVEDVFKNDWLKYKIESFIIAGL